MTGGTRVLYIDDDALASASRFIAERIDDVNVVTETRPADGLARLAEESGRFDCVVAGYRLPETDGLELLERVRESHPDLPFVLFAADGDETVAGDAIAAGVTAYVRNDGSVEQYELLAERVADAVEPRRDDTDARTDIIARNDATDARDGTTTRSAGPREQRLFREAIKASGHSVYFTDRNGTIFYVNPAFEETTGYTPEEALGQTPAILKSGVHDREFYEDLWDTILSNEVWRSRIVNRRKSGERYVVDQTIAPVENDDGDVEWFVAVNADITELERRERELERSRERLRALFEHSPDAIVVHDAEGNVRRVNRQHVENLGYSQEELLEMTVFDFEVEHAEAELRAAWAEASVGERIQIEGAHRRADGTTFPTEVWITKIEIDGDDRFVAFSRDITDRKRYERELERQIERLEQFATVVSHDLRNPLNVAEGRLDLLHSEYDSEHVDAAREALDRMEELIEDLLVLAREGGRASATEPVALGPTVRSCWQTVSTAEASLVVETDRTVRADRSRLQQLFENLLRNAVEHGGTDVTITVGDIEDGFYFADDGPGIPDDERERVFETGFTTSEDGTGLGLNIVKQIADAHGWDVAVEGSERGGARFEFTGVEVVE